MVTTLKWFVVVAWEAFVFEVDLSSLFTSFTSTISDLSNRESNSSSVKTKKQVQNNDIKLLVKGQLSALQYNKTH